MKSRVALTILSVRSSTILPTRPYASESRVRRVKAPSHRYVVGAPRTQCSAPPDNDGYSAAPGTTMPGNTNLKLRASTCHCLDWRYTASRKRTRRATWPAPDVPGYESKHRPFHSASRGGKLDVRKWRGQARFWSETGYRAGYQGDRRQGEGCRSAWKVPFTEKL